MTKQNLTSLPEWDRLRLIAFDVDGTLYSQRRLRIRMALDLLTNSLANRELRTLLVLRTYRRLREQMGEREVAGFETALMNQTASATGVTAENVRHIIQEWIEKRPLRYLARCRYRGLPELFSALRRKGKIIGVVSDYPAEAKLKALGLSADHTVYAGDSNVGILKPHPRGLDVLMTSADVRPTDTLMIGDRPSRDGVAARRAGAWPLIRSPSPLPDWPTFARFDDEFFAPILGS